MSTTIDKSVYLDLCKRIGLVRNRIEELLDTLDENCESCEEAFNVLSDINDEMDAHFLDPQFHDDEAVAEYGF